jgi:hypothetical protein
MVPQDLGAPGALSLQELGLGSMEAFFVKQTEAEAADVEDGEAV